MVNIDNHNLRGNKSGESLMTECQTNRFVLKTGNDIVRATFNS